MDARQIEVWQEAEAERNLGRLIDSAAAPGPQLVMRRATPAAFVLSPADYEALRRQADGEFADFLIASPFDRDDLDRGTGPGLADGI